MSAEPVDPDLQLGNAVHRGLYRALTVDEVEALKINGTAHVELLHGRLLVTPIGDIEHQTLSVQLLQRLLVDLPPGHRVLTGVNVYDGENVKVIPDVVVIDPERAIRDGKGVGPDGLILAVEITSPSNRSTDVVDKRELYEAWGVPYLLVDRSFDPHRYLAYGQWPAWQGAQDILTP